MISSISESDTDTHLPEYYNKMSDLDRGFLFLNDTIIIHDKDVDYEVIKDLYKKNVENSLKRQLFESRQKKCDRIKWTSLIASFIGAVASYNADLISQFFDPNHIATATILTVTLVVVIGCGIICFIGFVMSRYYHRGIQDIVSLTPDEVDTMRKLIMIIESWGKLQKIKLQGEDGIASADELADKCFREIRDLPIKVNDHKLPSKSRLASMTIDLLDDTHPLKKVSGSIERSEELRTPRDSAVGPNRTKPFNDIGQQGSSMPSIPSFSKEELQEEIDQRYIYSRSLQEHMNGLFIKNLHVRGKGDEVKKIPLHCLELIV